MANWPGGTPVSCSRLIRVTLPSFLSIIALPIGAAIVHRARALCTRWFPLCFLVLFLDRTGMGVP